MCTVVTWRRKFRMVCTMVLDMLSRFVGTDENQIQVDEFYFPGKRKYNRGRLLVGDTSKKSEHDEEKADLEDWDSAAERGLYYHNGALFNEDVKDWLWLVGICHSQGKVRFVRVRDRTEKTLKCVKDKYLEPGSVV